MMFDTTCPICNAAGTRRFDSWNGYEIDQCPACGHWWTRLAEKPAGEELYPVGDRSTGVVAMLRQRALGLFLRDRVRLARWAQPAGRLLDYGCGTGAFARAAHRAGWDTTGIEPFALGSSQGAAPRLLHGRLDDLRHEPPFDLITAWHVLEHVDDPIELLGELRPFAAPGGRVLVCVPNNESWQARLFGGSWFHLDPPRHLHHFSRASLERTFTDGGWRIVGWRWWLPEYSISGWVQSALNQWGPTHNVLYEAAKDRGALDDVPDWRRRALLAGSLAAAAVLAPLSVPVAGAAAAAKASATLTVAAEVA